MKLLAKSIRLMTLYCAMASVASFAPGGAGEFQFVNKRGRAIEVRYWDTRSQSGCGTLEAGEECKVAQVGEESHYCWQYTEQGGRDCDPVEDGCPVEPGTIEIDSDECALQP